MKFDLYYQENMKSKEKINQTKEKKRRQKRIGILLVKETISDCSSLNDHNLKYRLLNRIFISGLYTYGLFSHLKRFISVKEKQSGVDKMSHSSKLICF